MFSLIKYPSNGSVGSVTNIINNISNLFLDGTYLIDGGQTVWVEDYDFRVSAANYKILGTQYHSDEDVVTLSPADPTLDRIDVIAVDINGNVVVIEGTPNANPEKPYVDPETQLELTFVTVFAATTQPPTAYSSSIYNENLGTGGGEWNGVSSSGSMILNSAVSPRLGTLSVEGTNVPSNATLTFTAAAPVAADEDSKLVFYLKSKATWGNGNQAKRFVVSFLNGSDQIIGTTVLVLGSGTYGFDSSNTTGYQQVAIPLTDFNIITGDLISKVRFTVIGNAGVMGFFMDVVSLNFIEDVPNTGGGTTYSFINGLTELAGVVKLGGDLTGNTIINNAGFNFTVNRAGAGYAINAANTTGGGIYSQSSGGYGVAGVSSTSYGLYAYSASASAVIGISAGSVGGDFNTVLASDSSVAPILNVGRETTGTALDGIGGSIVYNIEVSTGLTQISNQLISKWTTANSATRTSQLIISGVNSAVAGDIAYFNGNGMVGIGSAVASATRLNIVDNTVAGASILNITTTSTAAAGNTQKAINIRLTGNNVTSGQITYGVYSSNEHGGTSATNYAVYGFIQNGAGGAGVFGQAVGNLIGVLGQTTDGVGVSGISSTGTAINGQSGSTNGPAANFTLANSSTNTILPVLTLRRDSTGTPANGIGASLVFNVESTSLISESNAILSEWIDATTATRTSRISLTGVNNAVVTTLITISGSGAITLPQGLPDFADDAAAAGGGIPVTGLYRTGSFIKIRVA